MRKVFGYLQVIAFAVLIAFVFTACEGPVGPAGPHTYGQDGQDGQDGEDGLTPRIYNGTWWIGTYNTGILAQGQGGQDGEDGLTPRIYNGTWWIGTYNTGIPARGDQGVQGEPGEVIPVTSILLSGDGLVRVSPRVYALAVAPGENVILTAAAYPVNALVQTLLWYSFDPGIANMRRPPPARNMVWTAPGMDEIRIDAHIMGTAEITVTAQGTAGVPITATVTVTVPCCAAPVLSEWTAVISPTAAAPGVAERNCENCSNIVQTISIPYVAALTGQTTLGANQPIGDITVLYIPYGVTSIGGSAFFNGHLEIVFIPDSVTFIGNQALAGNQLISITIPDSVTSIGNDAFWNNQLTSVTIGNSVTSIGNNAFANNQLISITIPDSVTSIEWGAFAWNQLTGVTIGNSVTSIGWGAFQNNQLASVTIPGSVTSIGWAAFQNNPLASVTIPFAALAAADTAWGTDWRSGIPGDVTWVFAP